MSESHRMSPPAEAPLLRVRAVLGQERLFLLAIAALNAITGLTAAAILAPLSFGADVDFLRRGAAGLQAGVVVPDFVFSPICAVLAAPLAAMPATSAAFVMLLLDLAIVVVGVALETRQRPPVERLLIGVAAATAIPVVNEVLLGQVTLCLAAALYPLRDRDGVTRGIALGVALAVIPKPLLLPALVWMLCYRRRALAGAIVTAGALTGLGLLLIGVHAYADWVAALRGAGEVTRQGSFSLWVFGPTLPAILAAGVVVAGFALSLTDTRRGFAGALIAGLLLAPYTLVYALAILLVAVRPADAASPRATRSLALITNLAVIAVPAAWLAAGLAAAAWPARRVVGRVRAGPEGG